MWDEREVCQSETAALLKDLIQIKSMSGQEEQLADFVGSWLAARGMAVSRDLYGNLYGEYRFGDGSGPRVLFNTHLDNVPVGEGWELDPFAAEERAGIVYGRGACDPKGAMAAMLKAAEKMICQAEQEKEKWNGTLVFMGAVSEEISPPSAKGTWKAVHDPGIRADMAICGEPTENLPCIGEFGKMEYKLTVHGKPAHGSAPEKGMNAILHLARLVLALDERTERRWSDLLGRRGTLNVGMISGGVQINIVAETAAADIERRLVPGQTAAESFQEMDGICQAVKEQYPELEYDLQVTGVGNAAVISQEEAAARFMAESVGEITGYMPAPQGFVAHADADWLITYGKIPTVIFGPGLLSDAHTNHEQVRIADVETAVQILLRFLEKALS